MSFFDRMESGWKIGMTSFRIIRENMSLLLFPVMSFTALVLILLSFAGGFLALFGFDLDRWLEQDSRLTEWLGYVALFVFYLISYFIIVFFNVALVHCARLIFEGKAASIRDGIEFSASRVPVILPWAIMAATVGVVLKLLEDRLGAIGKFIISLIGIVWSIATFFVVPVLAYENLGPVAALKRSAAIMKEKWGESIGANFGFGIFFILGYLALAVFAFISLSLSIFHPLLIIISCLVAILLLHTVVAAAETVFLAAAYNHLSNEPTGYFEGDTLDGIFVPKNK